MMQRTKKFRCWNNQIESYELELVDCTLIVRIEMLYVFKWIQVVDKRQNELYSRVYLSDSCRCELKIFTPGKYYFSLYGSNNGFNYEVFIGGKQIIWELCDNNQWYFIMPIYTSWNRELIRKDRLDYVLCDTLLENQHMMRKAAIKLTVGCSSVREKVLVIHDFVASNIYYDLDSLSSKDSTNRTIEQIVNTKRCVCQGYADLTLVLLKSIGIHTENILCYAIRNIFESGWSNVVNRTADLNHVITRVKLENRWLFMDVTWDSNNRYENGIYIKGERISHRYFDMTLPFLSATHRFF